MKYYKVEHMGGMYYSKEWYDVIKKGIRVDKIEVENGSVVLDGVDLRGDGNKVNYMLVGLASRVEYITKLPEPVPVKMEADLMDDIPEAEPQIPDTLDEDAKEKIRETIELVKSKERDKVKRAQFIMGEEE